MNVHPQLRFGLADIFILDSGPTGDAHVIASECNGPTQFQWIVSLGAEHRLKTLTRINCWRTSALDDGFEAIGFEVVRCVGGRCGFLTTDAG
jgi:hypothetical protein